MIASVEGVLAAKKKSSVIVEIGGLGVEVFVPERTLATFGDEGERIRLLTWLYVREDVLSLFGFPSEMEKQMFLSLISITGIGPRVAMGMLSATDASEIAHSIHQENVGNLVALPGIGKKTAERLILELKDKIDISFYEISGEKEYAGLTHKLMDEVVEALVSIGMNRSRARRILDDIDMADLGESFGVEDIVKIALKRVSL